MGFWFGIRWSKHILPCVSHWMQPETLDRMHGVAIWGLWKINSSRWIGEEDQASKHHRTSGEFTIFSLWGPPPPGLKAAPRPEVSIRWMERAPRAATHWAWEAGPTIAAKGGDSLGAQTDRRKLPLQLEVLQLRKTGQLPSFSFSLSTHHLAKTWVHS